MKKIITIIGASGELGFHLVRKLQHTYFLKCVVRDKHKKDFSNVTNADVIQVEDISHTKLLAQSIENSDVIINASYVSFAEEIHKALELVKNKPRQIVFTGSTGIFTTLFSKSAQSKRDAEMFIKANYNVNWTILRPTMIYGHPADRNISRMTRALKRFPVMPIIGKGDALIQPLHISDLVKAFEHAILNTKHFNKAYNIGSKHPLTNRKLFETISSTLNKKVMFCSVSPAIISAILKCLSIFRIRPISQEQVQRFQENKDIDIEPFIEAFGFEPISFEDGISQYVFEINEQIVE